jgi:hypothetical protein
MGEPRHSCILCNGDGSCDAPEDIADHHVCPGCHAVDGPCLPGCIDAEIEAERNNPAQRAPEPRDTRGLPSAWLPRPGVPVTVVRELARGTGFVEYSDGSIRPLGSP